MNILCRVREHWRSRWFFAVLTALITFSTYLFTLAPTVYTFDSAEISTAAYSLGLMHSPGYPVHLLLLHGFQKVIFWGDIGYRSNLFTALAGACSAGLISIFITYMTQRKLLGLISGFVYGWSFYTWSVAVIAEVYTVQTLLLLAILWCLWRWQQSLEARWVLIAAFIGGLALANYPGSGLWALGLLLLACWPLWQHPRPWQTLFRCCLMLCLGLLPLLYGPIRSLAHPEFVNVGWYQPDATLRVPDLTTGRDWWWYVSGQQFGNLFLDYPQTALWLEIRDFFFWLWAAFLGIGLPIGVLGMWQLWRTYRLFLIGTFLIVVPHCVFFIAYNVPDKATMFLPVYAIWAIYIGHGLLLMSQWWQIWFARLIWIWPVALLFINWSYCDVHDQWRYAQIARNRLYEAPKNTLYVARWGDAELMRYMQVVEHIRSDVYVINAFFASPDTLDQIVKQALETEQPVYSAQKEPLLPRYFFVADRFGYRVINPASALEEE